MKKLLFTFFIGLLISINSFSQEKLTWHTNIDEALELATKENKKVLLFFTGSDWCGWCKKLQSDVLKTQDFQKWSTDFILVELDFPRRTAQDIKIKTQNRKLQRAFNVRGFPTIHFVSAEKLPNGKTNLKNLGKTGYVRGGVKNWIKTANNIVKKTI